MCCKIHTRELYMLVTYIHIYIYITSHELLTRFTVQVLCGAGLRTNQKGLGYPIAYMHYITSSW